jgi:hypothetical protein
MSAVDKKHWHLFADPRRLHVRVVEYHRQVAPGPGLPDPKHYDMDSCITVDIVLSAPPFMSSGDNGDNGESGEICEREFEGGAFCTLEASGSVANHSTAFQRPGDAVMFVSHKFHCVQKVTKGTRRVLVLEFWRGPTRTCDHRCESLSVICRRERGSKGEEKDSSSRTPRGTSKETAERPSWLPFRLGAVEGGRLLWQTNMVEEDPLPHLPAKKDLLNMNDQTWDLFGDDSSSSDEGNEGNDER